MPTGTCLHQRLAEPAEIGALGRGPICERRPEAIQDGSRVRLATIPGDRQVRAKALNEAPDEPVIAGSQGLGLGGQRHAPRFVRGHHQLGSGRMERDGQLGVAALDRPPAHRTDGVAVFGEQPGFDALEQALARGDAQDQATPRGLADDAGKKRADDHRCHGSVRP
jgi:hypothetical protein